MKVQVNAFTTESQEKSYEPEFGIIFYKVPIYKFTSKVIGFTLNEF